MPWYILSLTHYSEKKTLECANELYESGDFAASVPDLVTLTSELLTVRSITTLTTAESSEFYDLHGRRLSGKPTKGLYIQNGQKKVIE